MGDDDLRELASGFRKRTLVTARLAGKVGLAMAKRTLRGRDEEGAALDADKAKEGARALVRELGALKGS